MPLKENLCLGLPTRPDTNRAVQPMKMVSLEILNLGSRGIVLSIKQNKGTVQQHDFPQLICAFV